VLADLFKSLSVLSVELVPIHQRLVQIRRTLSSLAAMEKPSKSEVKALMEELRKIDGYVSSSSSLYFRVLSDLHQPLFAANAWTESSWGQEVRRCRQVKRESLALVRRSPETPELIYFLLLRLKVFSLVSSTSASRLLRTSELFTRTTYLFLCDRFVHVSLLPSSFADLDSHQQIFDRLTELRAKLERLSLTHRWTLRETDLYK
jgi:hypothetical protein